MEIRFEKKNSARRGGRAYGSDESRRRVTFGPARKSRDTGRSRERAEETAKEPVRSGGVPVGKFGIMFSIFLFAAMVLFMLSGYEKITRSYQEVNSISDQIEETKLNINALEVAIECAVTIEDAQNWAKAHNMQYPLQSQYVISGSSVPISRPQQIAPSVTSAPVEDDAEEPEEKYEPDQGVPENG